MSKSHPVQVNLAGRTEFLYSLRFFASVAVVFFHYSPWRNPVVENGHEAVGFFFLLSGFVLVLSNWKAVENGSFQIRSFLVKRLARIYPLYLIALLATVAYHFLIDPIYSHLWERFALESVMIQAWLFPGSLNYPAWSVSSEWFFYLLFPILLVQFNRRSLQKAWFFVGLVVVLAISAHHLALRLPVSATLHSWLVGYFIQHPLPNLVIFMAGISAGLTFLKTGSLRFFGHPAILLVAIPIICFTEPPAFQGISLKTAGIMLASLFVFEKMTTGWTRPATWLSGSGWILLGEASYGIYLLQNPVFLFSNHFLKDLPDGGRFSAGLLILTGVSILLFKLVEKPVKTAIVNRFANSSKTISTT